MTEDLLRSAKHGTKRAGQKDLINYLEGKRLTQRQAIKAKCYNCNGMGEQSSCDTEECPLLPHSPYKKKPTTTPSKAPAKENEA
jgi:hypothetical protein